jgi:hypothetical protein
MRSLIVGGDTDELFELSEGEGVGEVVLVGSVGDALHLCGGEQLDVAEMVG